MSIYRLEVAYDGTDFYGWQKQPNVETIQGRIEACLNKIFKTEIKTIGSGRTDAGVHAKSQIVKLEMGLDIDAENIKKALNDNLPDTIRVRSVQACEDFHPVFDAKWKVYRYGIAKDALPPVFNRFVLDKYGEIDISRMRDAAKLFVGEHSFHNYFCVGTPVDSYVRIVKNCQIIQGALEFPGFNSAPIIYLEIEGNGFLKQMVRLIMGTILAYHEAKITLQQIEESFELNTQGKLSKVAPAKGLMLYSVTY